MRISGAGMTRTAISAVRANARGGGKILFLAAFLFACFLFWWLPSLVFRFLVHTVDPVQNSTLMVSVVALGCFVAAYLLPIRWLTVSRFPTPVLDGCQRFAFAATVFLGVPAVLLALAFMRSRAGVDYGSGEGLPGIYQAVFYAHMFVGFLALGTAHPEREGWRRVLTVCALITLPRLIVSLHWGRFFIAQAVVPILFIAVSRGWIALHAKRLMQLALVAIAIIFVPALTRGDDLSGSSALVQFFASGSTLGLYQDNVNLNLSGRCPPLLVSLTAKIVPYSALHLCVIDLWGMQNLPATLDRLLAYNAPGSEILLIGPGSNYLLELSVTGGLAAVLIGSALFGLCCRFFVAGVGMRSAFAGIWADCLTRAMLAPRGDLGYVFEQVPALVAATGLLILLVTAGQLLRVGAPRAPVLGPCAPPIPQNGSAA
jgi:hypothetical protein